MLEVAWTPNEVHEPAVHGEAVDLDDRRNDRIGNCAEPKRQPASLHGHGRKQVDAERLQLDVAVEPILERGDDEPPERLGSRACGRDNGEHDDRPHDRGRHPRRGFECHRFMLCLGSRLRAQPSYFSGACFAISSTSAAGRITASRPMLSDPPIIDAMLARPASI